MRSIRPRPRLRRPSTATEAPALAEALAQGPVILDGGLATELERQGHDLSSAQWSARLITDDPVAVMAAHRAYFAAGAQVATTASYQAGGDLNLVRASVALAVQARNDSPGGGPRWVAGSVGPYGAHLADGSEYRGDYGRTVRELRVWHRPTIQVLADSEVDVIAFETVPCLAEAEALLAEVAGTGKPCWLSLTCADGQTRAGEPVTEAYAAAGDVAEVIAVGVNCTHPAQVEPLIRTAARASGKPAVVYPNSGEQWDAARRRWTGPAGFAPDAARSWVNAGARLVGGCCRIGPDAIAALAGSLRPIP